MNAVRLELRIDGFFEGYGCPPRASGLGRQAPGSRRRSEFGKPQDGQSVRIGPQRHQVAGLCHREVDEVVVRREDGGQMVQLPLAVVPHRSQDAELRVLRKTQKDGESKVGAAFSRQSSADFPHHVILRALLQPGSQSAGLTSAIGAHFGGDGEDVGDHDAVVRRRQPHSNLVIATKGENVHVVLNGMDGDAHRRFGRRSVGRGGGSSSAPRKEITPKPFEQIGRGLQDVGRHHAGHVTQFDQRDGSGGVSQGEQRLVVGVQPGGGRIGQRRGSGRRQYVKVLFRRLSVGFGQNGRDGTVARVHVLFVKPLRMLKHQLVDGSDGGDQNNDVVERLVDGDASRQNGGVLELVFHAVSGQVQVQGRFDQLEDVVAGSPFQKPVSRPFRSGPETVDESAGAVRDFDVLQRALSSS